MAEAIFDKKSFVVVTGASRGLGKTIALRFSQKLPPQSVFVLMARNVASLEDVRKKMQNAVPDLKLFVKKFDQGNLEQSVFDVVLKDIVRENAIDVQEFQQAIIVHNAAVVDDVTKLATQMTQVSTVKTSFDINVSGMILLNSAFFQLFSDSKKSRVVVNVSSDNTKIADPSLSLYCAGKAARDMYFRVLIAEDPTVRVLTYNPGCMDTDMLALVRDKSADPTTAKQYKGLYVRSTTKVIYGREKLRKKVKPAMYTEGKVITCDTSVDKMIQILEKNSFENASYVDVDDPL